MKTLFVNSLIGVCATLGSVLGVELWASGYSLKGPDIERVRYMAVAYAGSGAFVAATLASTALTVLGRDRLGRLLSMKDLTADELATLLDLMAREENRL
jgi:hypothetical protein